MGWIFFLALLAVGYQIWPLQQKAKESAVTAVRRRCQQEGLQLLDDTLVLERMRVKRPGRGQGRLQAVGESGKASTLPVVVRTYRFEFSSTGDQRYKGLITLQGRKVASIEMEPYRSPNQVL